MPPRSRPSPLSALPLMLAGAACSSGQPGVTTDAPSPPITDAAPFDRGLPERTPSPMWDIDRDGIPPVVTADYVELAKIGEISLFRSSMGHDYWDSFERCRSLKHYFIPRSNELAPTIAIRAPFDAEVERVDPEWAGVQLHLRARQHPAFTAILFHVTLATPLQPGQMLDSGQLLGHHVGAQTASDVALAVNTPAGRRLISYIDALAEPVWAGYAERGVPSRRTLIITREERDADPLVCDGERFVTTGRLPQRHALP